MAQSKYLDDLCLGVRQQHRSGLLPIERQPVAFIGTRVLGGRQQRRLGQHVGKRRRERRIEHWSRLSRTFAKGRSTIISYRWSVVRVLLESGRFSLGTRAPARAALRRFMEIRL